MEALLRWNNPQQGLMEPIQFIQQLESSKKIIEVGGWVLSESCKQAQKWSDLGNPLQVSVNISSRQLQSGTLQLAVEQALEESGLAAGQLELEVSESLFMGGDPEIRDQLDQLRQLGVQLTIDNFGTGCSSLKSLTQFALHTLKVDRSFMVDLVDNRQSQMLVSAIISMVHALGIKAVVEGVETREQMRLVEQMGADYVQGFLFSRALDVEQFQMLLDSSEVGRFQLDDQAAAATSLRSGE
jgi:EAL domain-containing protein (putative c-di-GMP-specific phosphodiesterase class I)